MTRFESSWLSLALLCTWACADTRSQPPASGSESALIGRFETYIVDHADGSSREAYAVVLDSGERVELELAERPALRSGERVELGGRYVANDRPLSPRDGLRLGAKRFAV